MVVPIIAGPLKGKKWIVGAAAGKGKGMSVVLNQSEPLQVKEAIKILKKDSICFDLGANVGFYTLLFSQYARQVYAFEPLPRNLRYLIRLIEINKIVNAAILPCAVSDFCGIGSFSKGDNPAMGKLNRSGDIPVVVTTCDKFVAETQIVPDLIKVDVEGAEFNVFRGMSSLLRKAHPTLLLSVHSSQLREECLSFLTEMGYRKIAPIDAKHLQEAKEFVLSHHSD